MAERPIRSTVACYMCDGSGCGPCGWLPAGGLCSGCRGTGAVSHEKRARQEKVGQSNG